MAVTFSGIVLKVSNPAFNRERAYEIPVCGKPMQAWAGLAFGENPVTYLDYREEQDICAVVKDHLDESEYTVVLYSDTPLIQRRTVLEAVAFTQEKGLNVCRMTRGCVFNTEFLKSQDKIYSSKRYYFSDEDDFITANGFSQLSLIADIMRQRILRFHMDNGVYIVDPAACYIDGDVTIGKNVTVFPNNTLCGQTVIKDGVTLYGGNVITGCVIGEGATVTSSNINMSVIGARAAVGPYAYIRPECIVGEGCKIGDFVELKKAVIGDGSKISHLTYIGDCRMGKKCNIGCGCITANYDGKNKFVTEIGDNVFVGSNSTMIAPVVLKDNSFVAAGSTITDDVNEYGLAIARARQVEKPGWNNKKKNKESGGSKD